MATTEQGNYTPGDLMLGTAYYWKVTEVNEAEAVSSWDGDLWRFTTREYAVIDDFDGYDDEDKAYRCCERASLYVPADRAYASKYDELQKTQEQIREKYARMYDFASRISR